MRRTSSPRLVAGLFALAAALAGAGCAGPAPRPSRGVSRADLPVANESGVPLEGARDRLERARSLDAKLRLGFYSLPAEADGADPALHDLRREVAPETWGLPGREAIRDGGWLVVIQSPEVHRRLAAWAAERRLAEGAGAESIESEVRILAIRGGSSALLGRLGLVEVPGEGGTRVYDADGEAVDRLLADERVSTLAAPRLTTVAGQRASVSVVSQRSYLEDWELYQVDDELIADPVIGVVEDGLHVDLTARLDGEERIDLEATVRLSSLEGIDSTTVIIDPAHEPVTIEIPELALRILEHRATLDAGRSILVGSEDETWVLLTARRASRK